MLPVTGKKIQPDPLASKNGNRRNFCSKYDGYGEFCDGELTFFHGLRKFTSQLVSSRPVDSGSKSVMKSLCIVYLCVCVLLTANRVDDSLTPAPLSDKDLENHAIFQVPIAVIPGSLLFKLYCSIIHQFHHHYVVVLVSYLRRKMSSKSVFCLIASKSST